VADAWEIPGNTFRQGTWNSMNRLSSSLDQINLNKRPRSPSPYPNPTPNSNRKAQSLPAKNESSRPQKIPIMNPYFSLRRFWYAPHENETENEDDEKALQKLRAKEESKCFIYIKVILEYKWKRIYSVGINRASSPCGRRQ
jgi:hypothetical protein